MRTISEFGRFPIFWSTKISHQNFNFTENEKRKIQLTARYQFCIYCTSQHSKYTTSTVDSIRSQKVEEVAKDSNPYRVKIWDMEFCVRYTIWYYVHCRSAPMND